MFLIIGLLSFSISSFAGVYSEWKDQDGQINKSYSQDGITRIEADGRISIGNIKKQVSYNLNPKKKTYTKHDFSEVMNNANQLLPDAKKVSTGKTKKIGKYTCEIVVLKTDTMSPMMGLSMNICQAHYRKLGISEKSFKDMLSYFSNTKTPFAKVYDLKSGLIPIYIESKHPKLKTEFSSTLIKIEEKDFPGSLFQVPSNYKLVKMNKPKMPDLKSLMKNLTPEQKKKFKEMMKK